MSHNVLFNFINTHVAMSQFTSFEGNNFSLSTDRKGTRYYRFDLASPIARAISDQNAHYNLRDHHISVYETEDRFNLSQYHYTGYFISNDGKEYQLHVYFDVNGLVTTPPVFAINDGSGHFNLIAAEQFNEQFVSLATASCKTVTAALRKQLETTIQTLETAYHRLEDEACVLSETVDKNYDVYLSKLDEVCLSLQQIIPLVRHNHYQKIEQFIHKMQISFKSRCSLIQEQEIEVPQNEKVNAVVDTDSTLVVLQPIQAPQPNMLDSSINDLVSRFVLLKHTDDVLYTKNLVDILRKTYEMSLLVDENGFSASLVALKNLRKLNGDVRRAGEQLLPLLLLVRNYKLAQELDDFHYMMTSKYLTNALSTQNHDLLDFLLENGGFSINTQQLTVQNIDYASAVHFCIERDTPTKPLAKCLAVLIKHNASLLVCDERGLPIAHRILSKIDHPLRHALMGTELNRAKTVGSIEFNNKLVSALTIYLTNQKLDAVERQFIEGHLEIYRRFRQNAIDASALTGMSAYQSRELATVVEKHGSKVFADRLSTDPDIIRLNRELYAVNKGYLKTLSPFQKRQEMKYTSEYFKRAAEFADDLVDESYEEFKLDLIRHLKSYAEHLRQRTRFNELQAQAKSCRSSKELKRLHSELGILIQQLNDYSRPLREAEKDLKAFQSASKALDTLSEGLSELEDVLRFFSKPKPKPNLNASERDDEPKDGVMSKYSKKK